MAVRVRFEPDRAGIASLFTVRGDVGKFVMTTTRRVLARAKINVNVDTGRLRNSGAARLTVANGRRVTGEIEFTAKYAAMVHDGTRPHVIRPKRAKVLAFTVGGRKVYATKVHHPGYRGNPYLADALKQVAAGEGFAVENG